MVRVFFIFLLVLLAPFSVSAEMYECDGVWTNRPCGAPIPKATATTAIAPLESSASDILADSNAATVAKSEKVKSPAAPVPQEKRLMIAELKKMNKACRSYYSPGVVRQFERDCLAEDASVADCYEDWTLLHSEMLGRAQDDICRSEIFSATNRVDNL